MVYDDTFRVKLLKEKRTMQTTFNPGEVVHIIQSLTGLWHIVNYPALIMFPGDWEPYLDDKDFEKLLTQAS